MSFPKAKTKRFNEVASCAPPVGSYDPKMMEKVPTALIDSKDDRFKEPKPLDSQTSHLLSHSVMSNSSLCLSTSKRLSSASSTESFSSELCVSGIPKKTPSSSNIMAPPDLAKIKDLERQIRLLVQERNELHKRVQLKEDELKKSDSRLQQALKDRTAMVADLAVMEKELADLRKGNEILKTKELNTDRLRQLQIEMTQLQEKMKRKDKEILDMQEKLKFEVAEKNSVISSLKQNNCKLVETNKELAKEVEDKSLQLRLLIGNNSDYETNVENIKAQISVLKAHNQKFIVNGTNLVGCCDKVKHFLSYFDDLQKLTENVTNQMRAMHESFTEASSEECRELLLSRVNSLKASVDASQVQKNDQDSTLGDMNGMVQELIDAAVGDVDKIESLYQDLLTLFSKLCQCQQTEEELKLSVKMLNEKIEELQSSLKNMTENREALQTLYEETVISVEGEKKKCEDIQLTAAGLHLEKDSLSNELIKEKKLSVDLQEKITNAEGKISQLNDTILSLETQICSITNEKEGLQQLNMELKAKTKDFLSLQDQVKEELKEVEEMNLQLRDKEAAYKCLKVEYSSAVERLAATEAECSKEKEVALDYQAKLEDVELRMKLLECDISSSAEEMKAEQKRLLEELNISSSLVSAQQNQLEEYSVEIADLESKVALLEKKLNLCEAERSVLEQLKEQLQVEVIEYQKSADGLNDARSEALVELGAVREQLRCLEEEREKVVHQTKEQLDHILSESNQLKEQNQKFKDELELKCNEFVGVQEQVIQYQQKIRETELQMSSEMEKVGTLEKARKEFQAEVDEKVDILQENLTTLRQEKSLLETSMETLETQLSESQASLAATSELLSKKERDYDILSLELDSSKNKEEEAENLISRLQGEVQAVRLQMEQAEFAKTELEVAKAYVEKDFMEVNDRLKEVLQEIEQIQQDSAKLQTTNAQLTDDKNKNSAHILCLENAVKTLNCSLLEANNMIREKEDIFKRNQEENDLKLNEQLTKIMELGNIKLQCEEEISDLALKLNNSLKHLETKTEEFSAVNEENDKLQLRITDAEEAKKICKAECSQQIVKVKELTEDLQMLQNDLDEKDKCLYNMEMEKNALLGELNCTKDQMTLVCVKHDMLQQTLQQTLKKVADERKQLSSQLETVAQRNKHLEMELQRSLELTKSLESNFIKDIEQLKWKLDEERRHHEMGYQRQLVMQQEFRVHSDRQQMQLDCRTRELNEANDIIQKQQKTLDQYADQLTEMNFQHKQKVDELTSRLEQKSLQCDDISQITEEAERWKAMYNDLWTKVKPFKDQFETFEKEKQVLLGRSKNAQLEIEKLSHDFATILGHQNQKQKIHHILKLKDENASLKKEVDMLRDKEVKNKKQIGQLTEKLDALEGKRRFDPSKAFKAAKENDLPTAMPFREENR